jgi:hypothetical protein
VGKFGGGATAGHEPLAPVDGLPVVDGLAGVEEDVEQLVEMMGTAGTEGGIAALGVDVGGCAQFALVHEHLDGGARG